MAVQAIQDGFYYRQYDAARREEAMSPAIGHVNPSSSDLQAKEAAVAAAAATMLQDHGTRVPVTPSMMTMPAMESPGIAQEMTATAEQDNLRYGHGLRQASAQVVSTASPSSPQASKATAASSARHAQFGAQHADGSIDLQSRSSAANGLESTSYSRDRSAGSGPTTGGSTSRSAEAAGPSSRSVSAEGRRHPKTDEEILNVVLGIRERSSRSHQKHKGMSDFRFPPTMAATSSGHAYKTSQSQERSASASGSEPASSSELESLDLSRWRLARIPDVVIENIRDDVVRLALASNRLTQLPSSFATLQRLRYLNIRSNALKEIPQPICELPTLDILDIGSNRIEYMPRQPGTLLNLGILAIGSNRLRQLPVWMAKMKNLRTAKLTPNPIEWPPSEVMKRGTELEADRTKDATLSSEDKDRIRKADERAMSAWINDLQSWLEEHAHEAPETPQPASATESVGSARQTSRNETGPSGDDFSSSPPRIRRVSPGGPSRSRADDAVVGAVVPQPASVVSTSAQPASEAVQDRRKDTTDDRGEQDDSTTGEQERPATSERQPLEEVVTTTSMPNSRPMLAVANGHLRDGSVASMSSAGSRSHISRAGSSSSAFGKSPEERSGFLAAGRVPPAHIHMRNNSHSVAQSSARDGPKGKIILKGKKSLPDLRQHHGELIHDHQYLNSGAQAMNMGRSAYGRVESANGSMAGDPVPAAGAEGNILPKRSMNMARRPPLPQSHHQSPGQTTASLYGNGSIPRRPSAAQGTPASPADEHQNSPTGVYRQSPVSNTVRDPPHTAGAVRKKLILAVAANDARARREVSESFSPSAQAEAERNSYFRRLSMLPPSTINKMVPPAVLHVVDSLRGVLYALSQMHSALKQYILFAVVPATTTNGMSSDDGRVSAPFRRVLDIASASMAQFIDALDRFDSMCRRGSPPASVVRDVFVACKDSVQIFRKVTGVLQLQLRALLNTADVRYTRTLLLMLHGSIAEVSNSYLVMAPQMEAIMPYLNVGAANADISVSDSIFSASSTSTSISSLNGGKSNRVIPNGFGHATAASTFSTPSLPSIAEQASPSKTRPLVTAPRPARNRHAGNFSARDVEQGAMIAPAASATMPSSLSKSAPPASSMEQLINEEKQRLEAAANGDDDYGQLPPPPLPLSEISVHLSHSGRSRSGSGTGSENGQLLSASSSTGSGNFDSMSSSGGLVSGGGLRRARPPDLGQLPTANTYQDDIAAGYPRSPGGRPILMAPGIGFGPRRGEGLSYSHVAQDSVASEGRRGYFDHAHSRSMPSRPVRRGRTGSTASAGSAGANSASAIASGGWGYTGQPPLPSNRPNTANSAGGGGAITPKTAGSASGRRERERVPVADDHLLMLTDQLTSTASNVWAALDVALELAAQQHEQDEQQHEAEPASATANGTANGASLLSRRMRDVTVQLASASSVTEQLRATLEAIRASLGAEGTGAVPDGGMSTVTSTNLIKQPAAEIKRLWEGGNVLVRTIVQISTFVKGITSEHDFPRELLRSLGELTSVCSQLMVHMHFLDPGNTGGTFASRSVSAGAVGGPGPGPES